MLLCSIDSLSEPLKNSVLKYLISSAVRVVASPAVSFADAAGVFAPVKAQPVRTSASASVIAAAGARYRGSFARASSRLFHLPASRGHHGGSRGKSGG
jgi:hypothetical protein